jgi:hypothetical protein
MVACGDKSLTWSIVVLSILEDNSANVERKDLMWKETIVDLVVKL